MKSQEKNRKFFRFFLPVFLAALLLPIAASTNVVIGVPPSQRILLIGSAGQFYNGPMGSTLSCYGTVTTVEVSSCTGFASALAAAGLPTTGAALAGLFDQIWDVRWPNSGCNTNISGPFTTAGTDQNIYGQYLINRGSIFFMLEWETYDLTRFSSFTAFMNNITNTPLNPPPGLSAACDCFALNIPNALLAENFGTNYYT